MLAALAVGCARQDVTPFALGARIPLGHVTLAVHAIDVAPADAPGTQGAVPEDTDYAVYVSCSDLPAFENEQDRVTYISNFLERQLALVDSDGDRYRAGQAHTKGLYDFRPGWSTSVPPLDDPNWVVSFRVPEISRDFTLLLRNPDPQPGQPVVASVHLGMP